MSHQRERMKLPFFAPNLINIFGRLLIVALLPCSVACGIQSERRGLPPEVQSAVASVTEDIEAERYDKVYNEASELWKQDSSLEQSTSQLRTIKTKLGKVKNRNLHSATEQENSGGPLKGRAYHVIYQTNFENGEGMESFTLVERNGQWLLARYRVNSTALK